MQYLLKPLLKRFESFWLSFVDKAPTRTYNSVSLTVKIILSELASSFSVPAEAKILCFAYLNSNSTLQLINGILIISKYCQDASMAKQFLCVS